MSLMVASNVHISTTLFRPLSKVVNDSKNYVPAVPIIMSFKVLKEFPIDKISLFRLVSIFYEKNICPKYTQRQQSQNKVNEAKTVGNIASWHSDFIYRDLELEN